MTIRFPVFAALALAAAPTIAQAQAADPAPRIAAYNQAVLGIMKGRLSLTARIAGFDAIVRTYYDMPAITALAVGPKWASASPAERAAAVTALTRHSAIALARNFASFGGERFVVDPDVVTRDTSRLVRVTISSGGSADTLVYRLRQSGGQWKIIDVISDGISQLSVQRADFAATVAAGGVAGLTRHLARIDQSPQR